MEESAVSRGHSIKRDVFKAGILKWMEFSAIGPKPNTFKKGKGTMHRKYKYLLKKLKISHPNRVWVMDSTHMPVQDR